MTFQTLTTQNVAGAKVFKEENSNLLIQFTQEMSNAISRIRKFKDNI